MNKITHHDMKNLQYQNFIKERKINYIDKPLHLNSFRIYLAYNNLWKLINRQLLTSDEINIIHQLGCYKPPRFQRF